MVGEDRTGGTGRAGYSGRLPRPPRPPLGAQRWLINEARAGELRYPYRAEGLRVEAADRLHGGLMDAKVGRTGVHGTAMIGADASSCLAKVTVAGSSPVVRSKPCYFSGGEQPSKLQSSFALRPPAAEVDPTTHGTEGDSLGMVMRWSAPRPFSSAR